MIENHVQKLRREANMTQEGLARQLEVTRQTVISLEKNRYVPSLEMGFKVARLFRKNIEEVFFYSEQ